MNITTKFGIGDKVYYLSRYHAEMQIACSVCNDTKKVDIKGTLFKCPNCERGTSKWRDRWFVHADPTTIGEVRIEVKLNQFHSCNYFDEDEVKGDSGVVKEQYMLSATGVGSGTLWGHHDLFLSQSDAEAEANKRNEALIQQESLIPA